jgi:hypothetical protein
LVGREAAALCVLIIDRNARLADDHPYRARSALGCWHGLTRHLAKGATNMRGLLMSVDDRRRMRACQMASVPRRLPPILLRKRSIALRAASESFPDSTIGKIYDSGG